MNHNSLEPLFSPRFCCSWGLFFRHHPSGLPLASVFRHHLYCVTRSSTTTIFPATKPVRTATGLRRIRFHRHFASLDRSLSLNNNLASRSTLRNPPYLCALQSPADAHSSLVPRASLGYPITPVIETSATSRTCQILESCGLHSAWYPPAKQQAQRSFTLSALLDDLGSSQAHHLDFYYTCATPVVVDVSNPALRSSTPTQPRPLTVSCLDRRYRPPPLGSAWDFGPLVDAKKAAQVTLNNEGQLLPPRKNRRTIGQGTTRAGLKIWVLWLVVQIHVDKKTDLADFRNKETRIILEMSPVRRQCLSLARNHGRDGKVRQWKQGVGKDRMYTPKTHCPNRALALKISRLYHKHPRSWPNADSMIRP